MESDEQTHAAIVALLLVKKNKKKRKRSVWVRPCLWRRFDQGLHETLVQRTERLLNVLCTFNLRPVLKKYGFWLWVTLNCSAKFLSALCFFVAVFINKELTSYKHLSPSLLNKHLSVDCFCHG